MAITPLTVTIDLNPSYKKIPAVYVSQLDNNLRSLAITVQDGGVNYDVASSGYDVYVEGTKPDKHGFSYKVTDIGGTVVGSVVTVPMQTQMTCVQGMVPTEIVLKSGSDRIGSANFLLVVERAGLDEDTDVSETDIPGYIDGAQRAAEAAEDAKDLAVAAKDTAVSVAASIPEDYTTLSNDVDDLKTALDQIATFKTVNLFDSAESKAGYELTNYSADSASANYSITQAFPITEGKSYTFADNNSGKRCAFFAATDNPIVPTSNEWYSGYTPSAYATKVNWFVNNGDGTYTFNVPVGFLDRSNRAVSYFKFSYKTTDADNVMFYEGTPATYSDKTYVKVEVIEGGNNVVTCYGDSQTGGHTNASTANTSYPEELIALLGASWTANNYGNGGENINAIAWRAGALDLKLAPFTLPANNSLVSISKSLNNGKSTGSLFTLYNAANPCYVDGISVNINSSDQIKRNIAADSATTFTRPVSVIPPEPISKHSADVICILMGQNGGFDNLDEYFSLLDTLVSQISRFNKRYIVMCPWTASFCSSAAVNMSYAALTALFANKYGTHYFDVRKYLIEYGLDDNGLTPTAQDTSDIANGIVPTSLIDSLPHLNAYGMHSQAVGIYNHGKGLGYWS